MEADSDSKSLRSTPIRGIERGPETTPEGRILDYAADLAAPLSRSGTEIRTHPTMNFRNLVLLLAVPTAAARTPAAPPPLQGDVAALVAEEGRDAAGKSLDQLWVRAVELREAELLAGDAELDRVLDDQLARREELSPQAVLLFSASRLQGSSPDVGRLADALITVFDSADVELAAAAGELLGDSAFRLLAPTRKDELANRMLERGQDAARSPDERLTYAKSAYAIGGGKERIKANKVLRSFLDSQDPELRTQGALALAELDAVPIEGELRTVLERLERVPDTRGRLAAAYLAREELRELKERQLSDARDLATKGELPPELELFVAVLRLIQERHLEGEQVTSEQLVEHAIEGMLQWMDPHSNLLPSRAYAKFSQELEAEYGGIGAYVNDDPDDGLFTIVRPIYTGPAYRSGLMTDDKIVRIESWPTLGQPTDDIIKRLKGTPGTPVTLYIWRHGMDLELIERPTEDMKVVVTREVVRIPPGSYQMLPGGIGLLQLNTFSQVSMDEARKWIPDMLEQGMKALILDLRFNGGGLLTEAREVAELFLPKGKPVVSTAGRNDQRPERLRTQSEPVLPPDVPLVIMTGRHTASAAEIVSGALQDHGRAKLVGKTTYGKGSVQTLVPVPGRQDEWEDTNENRLWDVGETITKDWDNDGEVDYAPHVKLTVARYLLPSDRSIHRETDRDGNLLTEGGVKPDFEIDPPLIERWRYEEQRQIRNQLRAYVDETYASNRELFGRLAVNDQKDPAHYPGFDTFMAGLDTQLSRDDVRRSLRAEIRRRVQDDRGAEFPDGDFVEDTQMQKAIEVALSELGQQPDSVQEYDLVFDLPVEAPPGELALAGTRSPADVQRVRALVEDARSKNRALTREELDEVLDILGTIDDRQRGSLKKN